MQDSTYPINLDSNEYSQEFDCYIFAVKLYRHFGSWNTLNNLSNKACVPNKTEDLNLSVLNMIAGINELKTLIKHVSRECACKPDGIKCNSSQWWKRVNVDVCIENIM